MKKTIKYIFGGILFALVILACIGFVFENLANGLPWYAIDASSKAEAIGELFTIFILLIGGILLFIPKIEKMSVSDYDISAAAPYDPYGSPDSYESFNSFEPTVNKKKKKKKKKNTLCVIAFIFSIAAFFISAVFLSPIIPAVAVLLSAIGLWTAYNNGQSGTGLGKWGLALSLSMVMAMFVLAIITHAGGWSDSSSKSAKTTGGVSIVDSHPTEIEFEKGISVPGKNVYVNSSLDLGFIAPENWVMRSAEEMIEFAGDSSDSYEFSAFNAISSEQLYMVAEKLPSKNMTIDQCIKSLENNAAKENLIMQSDNLKTIFMGKEYNVIVFDTEVSGVHVTTEMYLRKEGGTLVYIVQQYLEGNQANMEPALNAFTTAEVALAALQS